VNAVSLGDLLFVLVSILVIVQFVRGHAPKSAVNLVVFVTPIVGTLLASGAVAFLLRQRKHAENEVTKLTTAFNEVCKDVVG
jgi:cytochrome c-type biogenesis protein CcmH/NrfF